MSEKRARAAITSRMPQRPAYMTSGMRDRPGADVIGRRRLEKALPGLRAEPCSPPALTAAHRPGAGSRTGSAAWKGCAAAPPNVQMPCAAGGPDSARAGDQGGWRQSCKLPQVWGISKDQIKSEAVRACSVNERTNPFKPGAGLEPPYLAGRDAERGEFSRMLCNIKDGNIKNMMVYGLRGVGKTVLVRKLEEICSKEGFLPIRRLHYNPGHSEPQEFASAFRFDMRRAIETFSRLEKTKTRIHSAVHYLKPSSVGVPGIMYYDPAYKRDEQIPLDSHLVDYLIKNWKVIERGGYEGAIFLFDEFHVVRDSASEHTYALADFISALNEVQAEGYKYAAVLCGLPTLAINVKEARSYSNRMFQAVQVSGLDTDEAKMALTEPLKDTKYTFTSELVSEIVKDTGGYPYFIQFYARKILEQADKQHIGIKDYRKVHGSITTELHRDFFDQHMDMLNNGQRDLLYAMSTIRQIDMAFSSIMQTVGMGRGTVGQQLKRLEEKGLVYRYKHGIYRFSLPMFRDYLCKRHLANKDA